MAILRHTQQFGNVPNVVRESRFHRGCNAKGRMNATEVVPSPPLAVCSETLGSTVVTADTSHLISPLAFSGETSHTISVSGRGSLRALD